MSTKAYGAFAADKRLEAMDIQRREPGRRDVQIDIAFCGVCHSDLHQARNEWHNTIYPCPATRSSAASARSAAR